MNTEKAALSLIMTYSKKYNFLLIALFLSGGLLISLSIQIYHLQHKIFINKASLNLAKIPILKKTSHKLTPYDFNALFGNNNNHITPKTNLNLQLIGIIASPDDHQHSSAIIQSNNKTKIYNIGNVIPGGAIITAILNNHVTLKNNEQTEALYFKKTNEKTLLLVDERQNNHSHNEKNNNKATTQKTTLQHILLMKESLQQSH